MAATTVAEFALSILVDAGKGEMTLNGLVASMGELEVASVGEIAILFELAQKLAALTDHAIKTSLGIADVTLATGMSSKKLQEWVNVADIVTGSGKEMAATLAFISQNLAAGHMGNGYGPLANLGELLNQAGTSLDQLRADAPGVMLDKIRDLQAFQLKSAADKAAWLNAGGIGNTLAVLSKSNLSDVEFAKYKATGPIYSDDEIKRYKEISRQMGEIRHLTETIGQIIAGWFAGDVQKGLSLVVQSLELATKAMKSPPTAGTNGSIYNPQGDLLGSIFGKVPLGDAINKMRYAYGASMMGLLGVSAKDNPFINALPASSSAAPWQGPVQPGQINNTFHTKVVTQPGQPFSKYDMYDGILESQQAAVLQTDATGQ